jgi:fructose-1,6-bisphosphatase/inositol monophosphatase family enzyme
MSPYTTHLDFAEKLAREAGALMRQNFTLGMKKEWKSDMTPLTATDLAVNALALRRIEDAYPADAIISEEGSIKKDSEYAWVCDPVDGTMPFSHGLPTFVFSLALTRQGESVAAVVYDPICDRLVRAEKGEGVFMNGRPLLRRADSPEWRVFRLLSPQTARESSQSIHAFTLACWSLRENSLLRSISMKAHGTRRL